MADVMKFVSTDSFYNGEYYRVVFPTVRLLNTIVLKMEKKEYMLFSNYGDLTKLHEMFQLMSSKKRLILYLDIKRNKVDEFLRSQVGGSKQDLVLLPHTLGSIVKDWKIIRDKAKKNTNIKSYTLYNVNKDYEEKNKGLLQLKDHSDTVFMIGRGSLFKRVAQDILSVKEAGAGNKQLFSLCSHEHLYKYSSSPYAADDLIIQYYESLEEGI